MQHAGASPQQFCLRWNNYQSNLTNVFDQLLQSESFVDVTLACDGHSVKAHKMVLSACSPYFQTLFFDNPCQHPIVIMRDIKWPELKAVVEFMYKGEINVSQEQIGPLLKVAESLKIRGLADVNGEQDVVAPATADSAPRPPSAKAPQTPDHQWPATPSDPAERPKKRRRPSGERGSMGSPAESSSACCGEAGGDQRPASVEMSPAPAAAQPPQGGGVAVEPLPLALPLPPQQQVAHSAASDDMEIKPGIAEMIREEERMEPLAGPIGAPLAKLLESSHAWLGASTSSIAADSYQYQLQSMWQKCWNTNQSLVHNLRFRERGPLKSWRPETMAEAIFSVLKEGLSLSQAARKYDIPYPTFVLYANRVHNMLGPSADGGSDLRPKGRGRPQRILLGVWPDEHIRGVIRAVVFRDSHQIKEETHIQYPRLHDGVTVQSYQPGGPSVPCSNGGADAAATAGAAASAAIAAVAQGLRQQMCSMVAAAAHHGQGAAGAAAHDAAAAAGPAAVASLVNSLALAGHCGAPPLPTSSSNGAGGPPSITTSARAAVPSPGAGSVQDLRVSPAGSALDSPLSSPLGLTVSGAMEPALNMNIGAAMDVGIGVSGMTYKPPSRAFASPRPENLFQEDIDDLVKPMHGAGARPKDPMAAAIKIEPLQECRGD